MPITQESRGLPHPTFGALSFRGAPAVSFFFALSGFLITYLLLDEHRRRGDVDVRAFYARRALRIWPLYFLVTTLGIVFYKVLLPAIGVDYAVLWPTWLAILMYVGFLPALFNSLFVVGGLLNPLWSIGVEEQFYLAWAPIVRRSIGNLTRVCLIVLSASIALSVANECDWLGVTRLKKFVGQLEFHFMAAGGLAAIAVHRNPDALLAAVTFRSPWVQRACWAALAAYLLVGPPVGGPIAEELLQLALYVWLIVETAVNPGRLVRIDHRRTEWLGSLSYGLYLWHMFAVYAVVRLFELTRLWVERAPELYTLSSYAAVVALTVLLSYLSHRCFEAPILRLKAHFTR